MFGFINVHIHLVWYAAFMAYATEKSSRAGAFERASFSLRGMELVLVLAYVQSALAKLLESGWAWAWDGTTLQIGMIRQGMPVGQWLAGIPRVGTALSCAALAMECGFALYFFVPALRRPLLLVSICFHLGTWVTMGIDFSHLWIFSAALLVFGPSTQTGPAWTFQNRSIYAEN
jgi:hypothetical protein